MRRKTIPQTFTITFDQYNAIHELADELRTNKSAIVQEALDLLLARRKKKLKRENVQGRQDALKLPAGIP